jgi:hypothetical protein
MTAIHGQSALDGIVATGSRLRHDPLAGILTAAATGTALAAAVGGLAILARRLTGGFALPPPAAVGWAVAAAGIVLVVVVDLAGSRGHWWVRSLARLGLIVAAVAVVPLADAVGWPERLTSVAALTVALGAALVPRARPSRSWRPEQFAGPGSIGRPPAPAARPISEGFKPHSKRSDDEAVVPLPKGFRQRLERTETEAGVDRIRGQVVLTVSTGSRTGHAHVGFCPSFAAVPTVELATDYDGVEAELTVAELLPWGLRLECRLTEPADEPLEIPVEFQARHTP